MQIPDISDQHVGTSIRCDCTYCGSHNSVSVTRIAKGAMYHCFDASCGKKGFIPYDVTTTTILDILNTPKEKLEVWNIPAHFIPAYKSTATQNWLVENNAVYAYKAGLVNVMFDPQQNRHVFLVDKYGAVGRKDKWKKTDDDPKWYKYGNPQSPLVVGKQSTIGVVVEDALSACAVVPNYVGISLLGTNFKYEFIEPIRELGLTTIIVALDKDASLKAIKLQSELTWFFSDVRVKLLEKDLKYYNQEQIKEVLK